MFSLDYSIISFDGNTAVTYTGNKARYNGGAVQSNDNCSITFDGYSTVTFSGNEAPYGGAVFSRHNSQI